jgi:hypothetical protein
MASNETGPYRVYFVEGSGDCFGRDLAALLAAIEERAEDIEHLATYATCDADGRWRQAAHVVGRLTEANPGPKWRPPRGW